MDITVTMDTEDAWAAPRVQQHTNRYLLIWHRSRAKEDIRVVTRRGKQYIRRIPIVRSRKLRFHLYRVTPQTESRTFRICDCHLELIYFVCISRKLHRFII